MMSISSQASRDFNKEIATSLGSNVKVVLKQEYPSHYMVGVLTGFEINTQSISLEEVKDEKNKKYEKLFIRGDSWATFSVEGEPFPMERLAKRLEKVLPGNEIVINDDNTISVLGGKIRITENGVQGKGPTKSRIESVYNAFMSELQKTTR